MATGGFSREAAARMRSGIFKQSAYLVRRVRCGCEALAERNQIIDDLRLTIYDSLVCARCAGDAKRN